MFIMCVYIYIYIYIAIRLLYRYKWNRGSDSNPGGDATGKSANGRIGLSTAITTELDCSATAGGFLELDEHCPRPFANSLGRIGGRCALFTLPTLNMLESHLHYALLSLDGFDISMNNA